MERCVGQEIEGNGGAGPQRKISDESINVDVR